MGEVETMKTGLMLVTARDGVGVCRRNLSMKACHKEMMNEGVGWGTSWKERLGSSWLEDFLSPLVADRNIEHRSALAG